MNNDEKIKNMFNEIAHKYDFMNNLISFGLHKIVRKQALRKLKLKENSVALDLCCGTGDMSKLLTKNKNVKKIVAVDFSKNMIEIAKKKNFDKKIEYVLSDCTKLQFDENSFDLVTMCFGLRNVIDKAAAIKEVKKVLKKGAYFFHLDLSNGNKILDFIFSILVPLIAKIFYGNNLPYKYLVQSKKEFYSQNELSQFVCEKGFKLHSEYKFLFNIISVQIFESL